MPAASSAHDTPTPPPTLRMERIDPTSPLWEVAQRVYLETYPEDDPAAVRDDFAAAAAYRDFIGLLAFHDERPVGVGFGARCEAGIWWYDRLAEIVGADNPALHDTWRLLELAVIEPAQGMGVGGALHDELLNLQPCPRALINTIEDNTRARTIYENRGWTQLAPPMQMPGRSFRNVVYWRTLHSPQYCVDTDIRRE